MANEFDQFDNADAETNPFDQFDSKGYLQNTVGDIATALNSGAQKITQKNLDPFSSALQGAGYAADAVYAPFAEGAKSSYNMLPTSVTTPINNAAASTLNAVKGSYNTGVNKLAGTSAGQSVGDYLMNSPGIQNAMNVTSDNAKAFAKLLGISPTGEAVQDVTKIVGNPIYNSGKLAADAKESSYIQNLVLPKETPTVLNEKALRTKQINGVNTYQPTPYEVNMAQTVKDVSGVSSSNTLQKNLDLVQEANAQEAQSLKGKLTINDIPIPDDTIISNIRSIRNSLPQNSTIGAPGELTIERVVNSGIDHITKNSQTASGLLQARKDFDAQMIREKGEGVFDPSIETPRSNAIAAVRGSMNKMIADAVPSADVMQSLAKQNALYSAADNIASKAAKEAPTPMTRFIQKVSPHGLLGVSGAAAADAAAHMGVLTPTTAAIAGGLYGAYKVGTNPQTRMILGKALGGGQ